MLKTILDLFSSSESTSKTIASKDSPTTVNVNSSISDRAEDLELLESSRKAEFKIWQGVKLEKQSRLDEAIALYRQALEVEPESAEAHQILAAALKKQNQIGEAAYHYAQAARLDQDNTVTNKIESKFAQSDTHNFSPLITNSESQGEQQTKLQLPTPNDFKTQFSVKENHNSHQQTALQTTEQPLVSNQQTVLQTDPPQDNNSQSNNQLTIQNHNSSSLVTQNSSQRASQNGAITKSQENGASLTLQKNNNGSIVLPTLNTTPSRSNSGNGKLEAARIYLKQALAYGDEQQWEQAIQSCQTALNIAPDCAEAYKVWGNILQRINRIADAIGCYAKAVAIDPNMAEAYANLGSLYARQQKWQEAVEFYQKSLAINPNSAGVYRSLAKIWEEFGEEDKALDCLFQALELEPNTLNAEQHFQLAEELHGEGKIDKAIALYRYAVTLDPDFRDAYLKLAKLLEQNGQWREAGVYYQEIIRIQDEQNNGKIKGVNKKRIANLLSSSPQLQRQINTNNNLKQLKGDRGILERPALSGQMGATPQEIRQTVRQQRQNSLSKTDLAIQQYLQQAKQEPNSAVVQINLGSLYARKQNWQKAIAHYSQAIKLDPNSAIGYRNLAKVYGKIGEPQKAAELLYQAYTIEPSNISGVEHWQLGQVFQQQNQEQKATACYRRAIQCQPDFTDAYISLGSILDGQNNTEGAIACFKQAVKHSPDNPRAYWFLGQVYTKEEQWQPATACYQEVIKLQPNNANALHRLGDALAKQEKWEPAIIAYQRAIGFNPDFSWSHNNLGDAWLKLHNWEAASESFRTAIALNPDFPWSYYKLGDALVELQQWSEAVDAYRRASELKPDLPHVTAKLTDAIAHSQRLNSEQTIGYYRDAIEREPDNLQLYYKALELEGDNAELYLQLANALERQSLLAEAISFYKIALQMQPDRPEIVQQLERAKSSL
ncbi:MAG: hypothetical protein Tsb0014_12540 [Pleurocapsa sp.]